MKRIIPILGIMLVLAGCAGINWMAVLDFFRPMVKPPVAVETPEPPAIPTPEPTPPATTDPGSDEVDEGAPVLPPVEPGEPAPDPVPLPPNYATSPAWPAIKPPFPMAGVVVIDDETQAREGIGTCTFTGTGWRMVSGIHHFGHGWQGDSYIITKGAPINYRESVTWTANIKTSGTYDVWATWYYSANRASRAEYSVLHDAEWTGPIIADQRVGSPGQTWYKLGEWHFSSTGTAKVRLAINPQRNRPPNHSLCADAVFFVPVGE